jgi:o-succinylbenzoate---CoA ligase
MLASAQLTIKTLGLKEDEKALICVNTEFIAGKMMLVRALENNMQIEVIEPSANPLLTNEKADFIAIVPLQLFEILKNERTAKKLEDIRNVIVGGGGISENQLQILKSYKNNIFHTYGMTETVSHIALRRLSERQDQFFTVLEDIEIRTDERECLVIKAAITNNEWIFTNDRAEIISNNKLNILGRIDNVINTGGIKIQAEELERKIDMIFQENTIPNAFYITSLPDEKLGNKIVLVVEGNVLVESIQNILSGHLSKFEMPKEIRLIDTFERTETGKIKKVLD